MRQPDPRLRKALFCLCVLCGFCHGLAFPQSNRLLTLKIRDSSRCQTCSPAVYFASPLHRRSFSSHLLHLEAGGDSGDGSGGPPRIGCSRTEGNSWWRGDDDNNGGKNGEPPGLKRWRLLFLSSLVLFAGTNHCIFVLLATKHAYTFLTCFFLGLPRFCDDRPHGNLALRHDGNVNGDFGFVRHDHMATCAKWKAGQWPYETMVSVCAPNYGCQVRSAGPRESQAWPTLCFGEQPRVLRRYSLDIQVWLLSAYMYTCRCMHIQMHACRHGLHIRVYLGSGVCLWPFWGICTNVHGCEAPSSREYIHAYLCAPTWCLCTCLYFFECAYARVHICMLYAHTGACITIAHSVTHTHTIHKRTRTRTRT